MQLGNAFSPIHIHRAHIRIVAHDFFDTAGDFPKFAIRPHHPKSNGKGDRHGRRLPVAIGLMLFVIGSAGCALADSIWALIGWRVVQAVGACAGVVLARAMVRDLYKGDRAAQMMSTLMTVMAIAPLLEPTVGGQILALAGWRAIFWTLVGIGLVMLAALFTLPETLPRGRRGREPLVRAFVRYGELLRHRRLLGYAGAGGFFYGGMFAYIAGTPFAYITYHHVPPQLYGLLFGIDYRRHHGDQPRQRTRSNAARRRSIAAGGDGRGGARRHRAGGNRVDRLGRPRGLAPPLFLFVSATGFIVANSISVRSPTFPSEQGPSRRWSARSNTAPVSSALRWSAPSPTARPDRWAG